MKNIKLGLYWDVDGHHMEVTKIYKNGKCQITETWIAEDTGKDCKHVETYKIGVDGDEEYAYAQDCEGYANPGHDGEDEYAWWARKYASGALNWEPEMETKEENKMDKKLDNAKTTFTLGGITFTETKTGYYYKSTGTLDKKGQPINRRIAKAAFEKAWEEFLQTKEDEEPVVVEPETVETEEPKTEDEKKAEPEVDHYTVSTFYAGMTGYVVKKNGVEVYNGFSADEIIERFGFNPNEVTEIDIPRKEEEPKKEEKKAKKAAKPRRSKDVAFEMDLLIGHITLTAKQVDFIKHLPDTNFWENGLDSEIWCDCLADEIGGQFAGKPMTVGAMISTLREKKLITMGRDTTRQGKPKFMALTDAGKAVAGKLGLE